MSTPGPSRRILIEVHYTTKDKGMSNFLCSWYMLYDIPARIAYMNYTKKFPYLFYVVYVLPPNCDGMPNKTACHTQTTFVLWAHLLDKLNKIIIQQSPRTVVYKCRNFHQNGKYIKQYRIWFASSLVAHNHVKGLLHLGTDVTERYKSTI